MVHIINITSFFNNYIDINNTKKLVKLLELMYKDTLINTEILLNLIKALVLIFHLDNDNYDIYYSILYYLYYDMNKNSRNHLFDKIKLINLSSQLQLDDNIIEDIIIATNIFIIDDFTLAKIEERIITFINIILIIQELNNNISLYYKIKLYQFIIKNYININDFNKIISYIKKY